MTNTFRSKDKIGILICTICNMIGYFLYIVMNFISNYKDIDFINYYTNEVTNVYVLVFFICWIGILGLTFYSLKGLWYSYKWQEKKVYYFISLLVFIIFAILYYPLYVFPFTGTVWIILAFLGATYSLFFLLISSDYS
jgi:hypothetical protein